MGVYIPLPRQYIGMWFISLFVWCCLGNKKYDRAITAYVAPMCAATTNQAGTQLILYNLLMSNKQYYVVFTHNISR